MNIEELYDLSSWLRHQLQERSLIQRYTGVLSALQQNQTNNKRPFEGERTALFEQLTSLPLSQLTNEQMAMLDTLGIGYLLGPNAVAHFEGVLFRNGLDIAAATQHFQQAVDALNNAMQWSNDTAERLARVITRKPNSPNDGLVLRVTFTRDAAFSNVADFKRWGDIWYRIGRGITLPYNLRPEDMRVVGASRGSLILEFLLNWQAIGTLGFIIKGALATAEKCLDIRKKAEEIRGLKIANDSKAAELAASLEAEATAEKKNAVETITAEITKTVLVQYGGKTDNEIQIELTSAIRDLIEFVDKGGEVDCVVPPDGGAAENKDDLQRLVEVRETFRVVRQLEHKVRLLTNEPKKDNDHPK